MKVSKLLFSVLAATVLLGGLVSTADARNLSVSSQTTRVTFTRINFAGGFGTVECEVSLTLTFHSRTIAKTLNALIGYITAATVNRCARGGATINQASLPWHARYRSFGGTLPNITELSKTITGAEWTIREPTFGITCTVERASAGDTIVIYKIVTGRVTSAEASGERPCGGINGRLEGSTTNVTESGAGRITITLI